MPDEFISTTEDNDLTVALGAWTLRQACRQTTAGT